MIKLGTTTLPILAAAALAAAGLLSDGPTAAGAISACRTVPGATLALLRVERDTTLPHSPGGAAQFSMSVVPASAEDSLLATPGTPMPAARVRLLRLDPVTRATLASHGVAEREPMALLRAAPYRADCRAIRWEGSDPFMVPGEVGYVRATLAPREHWIGSTPLLVVDETWKYPYPRRRSLAYGAAAAGRLASAEAMFGLELALEAARPRSREEFAAGVRARRDRAVAWARANPESVELEPVRALLRAAVLESDWTLVEEIPSRLRGTYRVEVEAGGERRAWFFRTHDRPGYRWGEADSLRATAELLANPYAPGYRLAGYAAGTLDSLPNATPWGPPSIPLAWLAADDRPTAPGNAARGTLAGMLEFQLGAAPETLWDELEALAPPWSAVDSAMRARFNIPRSRSQPRVPLTIRLDASGGVRADTTLDAGGRRVRVRLERVDTLSLRRP